jgi:hypothetical protein
LGSSHRPHLAPSTDIHLDLPSLTLRHFKNSTPDAIAMPDAHLAIGQPVDGEILSELPMAEIASTEPGLPMPV